VSSANFLRGEITAYGDIGNLSIVAIANDLYAGNL